MTIVRALQTAPNQSEQIIVFVLFISAIAMS